MALLHSRAFIAFSLPLRRCPGSTPGAHCDNQPARRQLQRRHRRVHCSARIDAAQVVSASTFVARIDALASGVLAARSWPESCFVSAARFYLALQQRADRPGAGDFPGYLAWPSAG